MLIKQEAFYSLLGIAKRAGIVTTGESGVSKAISTGSVHMVLLDAEASDNTKKKFNDACKYHQVKLFYTEGGRLGQAIGKPGRMSCAISAGSLCGRLLLMAENECIPQNVGMIE